MAARIISCSTALLAAKAQPNAKRALVSIAVFTSDFAKKTFYEQMVDLNPKQKLATLLKTHLPIK